MTTAERDSAASGTSQPGIIGIFVSTEAGAPMQQRPWVEVVPDVGILGDRYATRRGHWSDPRWREQQLTIIEAETADDLGLEPQQLRRNLVTRGVQLQGLLGLEFRIGGARLAGMLPCDPATTCKTCWSGPACCVRSSGAAGSACACSRAGGSAPATRSSCSACTSPRSYSTTRRTPAREPRGRCRRRGGAPLGRP